jgi:GTP-binding protein EngB required for normal cell division
LLLIFTKADKIKPVERERHASQCINYLQALDLKPVCLLYYSIKNPRSRIELVQLINHYFS